MFPPPFGRAALPEEEFIADLDSKTGSPSTTSSFIYSLLLLGASLKLTVINPNGRLWTMVAGGGASVIYRFAVQLIFTIQLNY